MKVIGKKQLYLHKDLNKKLSIYEKKHNCSPIKISSVYYFPDYINDSSDSYRNEMVGISLSVHNKITNVQNKILRFLILF
jgi:hypothetical protein